MARILIVDDNPTLLDVLVDCLTMEGFAVCSAPSAAAGLELLQRTAVDLIITDLGNAPFSATGFAPLAALRAAAPATPIVLATGYAEVVDQVPGAYAIAGVLVKPFAIQALLRSVQAALSGTAPPLSADELPAATSGAG